MFLLQEDIIYKKWLCQICAWCAKNGMILAFVCSEVNLSFAPMDTWWVDSATITDISVTMQGCLWSRLKDSSMW